MYLLKCGLANSFEKAIFFNELVAAISFTNLITYDWDYYVIVSTYGKFCSGAQSVSVTKCILKLIEMAHCQSPQPPVRWFYTDFIYETVILFGWKKSKASCDEFWRYPVYWPCVRRIQQSLIDSHHKLDESTARRQLKSPRSLSGRSIHLTLVTKWSWMTYCHPLCAMSISPPILRYSYFKI